MITNIDVDCCWRSKRCCNGILYETWRQSDCIQDITWCSNLKPSTKLRAKLICLLQILLVTSDGPPDGPHDKIFISSGAEVRGYSKKGKQFLKFDTNLTEPIRTM